MRYRFLTLAIVLIILGSVSHLRGQPKNLAAVRKFQFLSSALTADPALAGSPLEAQQAYPYQAGFPRTDSPGGITHASPSVVDLNRDGAWEVLTADGGGCVWGWNAKGNLLPGFPWKTRGSCTGGARINGPLAVGDIDNNGTLEVAAGAQGLSNLAGQRGKVFVWRANGSLLPGWPKEMAWNPAHGVGNAEVYSVALADVAGDGRLEILAGTSNNASLPGGQGEVDKPFNLYVWRANGSLLPGYPNWYRTAGILGKVGAADLTGDGYAEVIAGRDHSFVYVYNAKGEFLPGWPVRTFVDQAKQTWNVDPYVTFTNNAPAMGDLDGDGVVEIVIAGGVKSPQHNHQVIQSGVFVLEPNGQRRPGWQKARLGGGPLTSSFRPTQAPALADLDGDGKLEIIVALFDGTLRAYRENGALMWSYDYAQGKVLYGSEPAVGDVTGDGKVDIIFGTYSPDGSAHNAAGLLGLNNKGQLLPDFPLPLTHEGNHSRRGVRAGPTLADIDRDCDVEILAASQAGVLYIWDLPALYLRHRMPWPTSRHDQLRTGSAAGSLDIAVSTSGVANGSAHKTYLPFIFRGC